MNAAMPCPIPGYRFAAFGSWHGVQVAIDEKVSLFYKAPLDPAPRPVFVTKRFKNGKVRLTSGEVTFTVDCGHLDRFYWVTAVLATLITDGPRKFVREITFSVEDQDCDHEDD